MCQTSSASRYCLIAARPCDASTRTVAGRTPSIWPASSELNPIELGKDQRCPLAGGELDQRPSDDRPSSAVENSSSRSSTETVLRSATPTLRYRLRNRFMAVR